MKLIIRIRWEENRRHRQKAIPVSLEEGERVRTETIMFDIVNMDYSYTAIFSRGFINKFEVVIKQSDLSLSETVNIPSVFCFAECNPSDTQQRANLPSVVMKTFGIHITLGKKPDLPSVEYKTLGKQQYDTRQ